jgi:hypothetical protein
VEYRIGESGMTVEERNAVIKLMHTILDFDPYRSHDFGCEINQCDVCTCGLTQVRNRLREAYEECRNLVTI